MSDAITEAVAKAYALGVRRGADLERVDAVNRARTRRVTPARTLAVGGLLSGLMGAVGGFVDVPQLLGAAAALMLLANVLALVTKE